MAKLRFTKCLIFLLVAIFCTSASCSTDLFVHEKIPTPDTQRLKRDDAKNTVKNTAINPTSTSVAPATQDSKGCISPPVTPDKTYTAICPIKENCETKAGEQMMLFTVLMSKCNSGYAQYQDGRVSSNDTFATVCINGTWTPQISKCKRICNKLSSGELDMTCSQYLEGPRVPCNSTLLEGAVVVPRCKPLYHSNTHVNYRHVTCRADGTWDKEFFKCSNECGKTRASVVNLIAHGTNEKQGQAPWYVAVYSTENSKEPAFRCGGTLISSEFVVSGALCFYDIINRNKLDPRLIFVMVAKQTIDYKKMDYRTTKRYSVKTINFPEGALSNLATYNSDIAILQLSEPVTLNGDVLPACIHWDDLNGFLPSEKTFGKVSGFGVTENEQLASELQTVNIPYINVTDCLQQVSEDFQEQITLGKFCAGSKTGAGPRAGDSGGGLLIQDSKDGRYYLRGVASVREIGNSSVTVFTDISFHIGWIKKFVPAFDDNAQ